MQVRCRSKSAKYVVMQALNFGQREMGKEKRKSVETDMTKKFIFLYHKHASMLFNNNKIQVLTCIHWT